jgi:ATP-dependent RNA helicase DHX57
MQPNPPYYLPTAIEAKHWGATYALYRVRLTTFRCSIRQCSQLFLQQFCNGIQLNRALPPGPRDYWNELVDQHKAVSEDKKWMYDADPFDAKKKHEKPMQAARSSTEATPSAGRDRDLGQRPKSDYPEVLMATSLRELVEDAIKQVCSLQFYHCLY